jgi:hypothetical protein
VLFDISSCLLNDNAGFQIQKAGVIS